MIKSAIVKESLIVCTLFEVQTINTNFFSAFNSGQTQIMNCHGSDLKNLGKFKEGGGD